MLIDKSFIHFVRSIDRSFVRLSRSIKSRLDVTNSFVRSNEIWKQNWRTKMNAHAHILWSDFINLCFVLMIHHLMVEGIKIWYSIIGSCLESISLLFWTIIDSFLFFIFDVESNSSTWKSSMSLSSWCSKFRLTDRFNQKKTKEKRWWIRQYTLIDQQQEQQHLWRKDIHSRLPSTH